MSRLRGPTVVGSWIWRQPFNRVRHVGEHIRATAAPNQVFPITPTPS